LGSKDILYGALMCFLSCSLDSPAALAVPVLGTLCCEPWPREGLCSLLCPGLCPPPRSSPVTLLALQRSALMGNTDPLLPPFPMASAPTGVPWGLALRENLLLGPEESLGWGVPAETRGAGLLGLPPALPPPFLPQVLPADAFFPPRSVSSFVGKGFSPGLRGGTSVVQGAGSYLSADSTVITL